MANVSFDPGVRNNWHKHNGGFQIILATTGEGWYQEEGQPPVKLHTGDVAVAKDGVKRWPGMALRQTRGSPTLLSRQVRRNGWIRWETLYTRKYIIGRSKNGKS